VDFSGRRRTDELAAVSNDIRRCILSRDKIPPGRLAVFVLDVGCSADHTVARTCPSDAELEQTVDRMG
jgi:hypothetical protein